MKQVTTIKDSIIPFMFVYKYKSKFLFNELFKELELKNQINVLLYCLKNYTDISWAKY